MLSFRAAVGEIYKLIEEEDDIEISLSETKIRFAFGDAVLTSKLDGTFPDYDRVIPFGNDKTLELKRTELSRPSIWSPPFRPKTELSKHSRTATSY